MGTIYPVSCRGEGERGSGPGHPMPGGHPKCDITKIEML